MDCRVKLLNREIIKENDIIIIEAKGEYDDELLEEMMKNMVDDFKEKGIKNSCYILVGMEMKIIGKDEL